MYLTYSIAASWFFEYLVTIICQPPRQSAFLASAPSPFGSGETSTLPINGELAVASWVIAHMYGQLRAKAALPGEKTLTVSGSLYVVTSFAAIPPTQPAARWNAAMACGLLIETVPSGSMMLPPPLEYCHSMPLQVSPS